MSLQYTNNAETILTNSLSATATSLTLGSGQGSLFPVLNTGDWFPLTLIKEDLSDYEIVRVTGRVGDTLTIERESENTTGLTFAAGDVASLRITEAFVDAFGITGQPDFTILRGVNFSKSTGSVTSNLYSVVVNGVSSYSDDLKISFLPHSRNTLGSTSRLNVNGLGERNIVNPDGSALTLAAIAQNRRAEVHYSVALGSFVLDNAVPAATVIPTASTTVSGTAVRGNETDFDVDGDNLKFTTQRNVSRIVRQFADQQLFGIFDSTFINYGRGIRGNFEVASNISRGTGLIEEYRTLTISPGGTLNLVGNNTTVIRATEEIIVNGLIVVNTHNSIHPERMIGGRGTDTGDQGQVSGAGPDLVPAQQPYVGSQGDGASLVSESFRASIINVPDLQMFRGGHGRGARNDASAAHRTEGRAGLILIAPKVTFSAGASIDVRSVRGQGGAGHGAGGQIVVASPDFTLDPSADFTAGDGTTTASVAFWQDSANDNENGGGANAQLWHIDTTTGSTTSVF